MAERRAVQEKGFDTVDANRELGFDDDCREYTSVFNILADLGVASIKLMVLPAPRRLPFMLGLPQRLLHQMKSGKSGQPLLLKRRRHCAVSYRISNASMSSCVGHDCVLSSCRPEGVPDKAWGAGTLSPIMW